MRKFIINILLFAFPILFILLIVEIGIRLLPNEYKYKRKCFEININNIEVLVLGNSHSYFGINPDYLHLSTYNLAEVSQSIDYDCLLFERYVNRMSNLKYVVLPIDYLTLFFSIHENDEKWRVKNYIVYWDISTSKDKLSDYSEFLSERPSIQCLKICDYFKGKRMNASTERGYGISYCFNKDPNLWITGREAARRHTLNGNNTFKLNCNYLERIILTAEKQNVRVVLYSSPVYLSYVKNLNINQLTQTQRVISDIISKHNKVKYFDFSTDKSFSEKDYYDADHLNSIGAKKLSLKINYIINKLRSVNSH